ncbi:MAG: glycoside hydrolase family 15 protein [Deltaproteobacteria bacterium]|nr:glycoside hydrolase family 15 protein [Deltaproteobacteria bacterium]
MPRDLPVGNGRLLVCFDADYTVRDLYFPHVGQENHVGGQVWRFGVWIDGRFAWVGPGWTRELRYEAETLVTEVSLYREDLRLLLTCRDAVDFHEDVYLREVAVENLAPERREVRLFFCQNFSISGNGVGDTAAFDPSTGGLVHYKGPRYFLANGRGQDGRGPSRWAVGQKEVEGREGTWRDAEDGELSGNPIAQGSVDSVLGLTLELDGLSRGSAHYWLSAGQTWAEVRELDALVRGKGPEALLRRTSDYWRLWVRKENPPLEGLPAPVVELYGRSLLVLVSQIDGQGGILAANDSDVVQFNRDTYSYVWPRDGALAANALDLAGYPLVAQRFYDFAARAIGAEGYLLHKYNPDGTLASSWHPWFEEGRTQLPIQEDETALVLWALWHHFVLYRDIEFVKPLYKPLVKNAADFLCRYRDAETGLPSASYDLWEERKGTFSFTVGAVFGGLAAASLFCTVFGETERAERYRACAAEVRDAASRHLWREDLGRFCRGIRAREGGELEVDPAPDASLWGLFAFGLYGAGDPRIRATVDALRERLWVRTDVGGLARYEGDGYHRVSPELPGNPWILCTLWLADYLTERASTEEDLSEALDVLEWAPRHALASGVLAEQVDPFTGRPLSVSPLTWSHATFVASTQRLARRRTKIRSCPTCGLPLTEQARRDDWLARLFAEECDAIHGLCRVR